MTILLEQDSSVDIAQYLRITYRDGRTYTLRSLAGILDELVSLLHVAGWVEIVENGLSLRPSTPQLIDFRYSVSERASIAEVTYSSPLQLVLSSPEVVISTVSGLVFSAGAGAIGLFNKFQDAREKKAKTDYNVAVQKAMMESIETLRRQQLRGNVRLPDNREIDKAAEALLAIESIDVVTDPSEADV